MLTNTIETEIIAFTQALVRQASVPGQEGGAAGLVTERLAALDWDRVWTDRFGNVIATRQGSRPGPRLLFDAHMDVVPVANPEAWSCDPFGGELRDGRIWGRGSTDIKGGLAALLYALSSLGRDEFNGTFIFSASVGEELLEGAALRSVVAETRPDFALICEPTECRLGVTQKGRAEFWVQVSGRPAHTSRPELGDNAIYRAIEMVPALRSIPLPADDLLGPGVMTLIEISSQPFPGECIVPFGCRLRFDRRLVHGETRDSLLEGVRAALTPFDNWQTGFHRGNFTTYTGLVLEQDHFQSAWKLADSSPWMARARRGLANAGLPVGTYAVPFCTNGSLTAGEASLPTLVFGPSTIALAHAIDEYIPVDELLRGFRSLRELAAALSEAGPTEQ